MSVDCCHWSQQTTQVSNAEDSVGRLHSDKSMAQNALFRANLAFFLVNISEIFTYQTVRNVYRKYVQYTVRT